MNAEATSGDRADRPQRPHPARRIWFLLVALVVIAGAATALRFAGPAGSPPAPPSGVATSAAPDTIAAPHLVIAYYFHTTYRCSSCRKIEANAQRAITTAFEPELVEGRLVWRVINVEEKGNEHFVQDYQLYTKSVVLSDERAGREVRWKNLTKVWELLNDEAGFVDYVQTETRAYLDGTP